MPAEEKRSLRLLQVLRGLAAMLVVIHHSTGLHNEVLHLNGSMWLSGAAGVDIFFVISGFVMALSSRSLLGKSAPAATFMTRRIERIAPLYWLLTTLKVVLLYTVTRRESHETPGHLIASYLFYPLRNPLGNADPVLVAGWTLNFEMFFYVIFAAALLLRIKPLSFVPPILAVVAGLGFVYLLGTGPLFWCNPIVLEFLFGMLLFEAFQRKRLPGTLIACLLAALGFAVLLATPLGFYPTTRPFVWGLPALAIVTAALALESRWGASAPAFLLLLGDASYSLYLTHTLVLPLVVALFRRVHSPALLQSGVITLAAVTLSLVGGLLCYQLVERPILHFFRVRALGRNPATA